MTLSVIYTLTASAGAGDQLEPVLQELGRFVQKLPGSAGVTLLRLEENPDRFLFIEHWPSSEVYATASKLVPPEAFAPLKPLLGEPPARELAAEILL